MGDEIAANDGYEFAEELTHDPNAIPKGSDFWSSVTTRDLGGFGVAQSKKAYLQKRENEQFIKHKSDEVDAKLESIDESGYGLYFEKEYGRGRSTGIRGGFNSYAMMHQNLVTNESIYFGYYLKVLQDANGINLLIYTKDDVINWDPVIRSIMWTQSNLDYPFEIPSDKEPGKWKLYFGSCIYGVLLAHGKTVLDLCDILGYSRYKANGVVNGQSTMSVQELYIFADVFAMTVDEVMRR